MAIEKLTPGLHRLLLDDDYGSARVAAECRKGLDGPSIRAAPAEALAVAAAELGGDQVVAS